MMMSSIKPIPVITMNQDGSFKIINASESSDVNINQHNENESISVTDPTDLPKNNIESPRFDKNIPKNNWRDTAQVVIMPIEEPISASYYNPRDGHRLQHQQYAEAEKRAHESSKNNLMKIVSDMYDPMVRY